MRYICINEIQKISISKFIMILNIRTGCQDWFKFIWEIFRYDVDPGTTSNSFQLPKGELFAYSRYVCHVKAEYRGAYFSSVDISEILTKFPWNPIPDAWIHIFNVVGCPYMRRCFPWRAFLISLYNYSVILECFLV